MLKKNPVFISLLAICFLAFGALSFLAYSASGQKAEVKRQLRQSSQKLKSLLQAETSLTQDNVDASSANVAELRSELERISTELSRGSELVREEDGVRVIASIQQYISDSQRLAEDHTNADGEFTPIELPNDFAFGFDEFFDESNIPGSVEAIVYLNNQRQVLEHVVAKLIESSPAKIDSIDRESFAAGSGNSKSNRTVFKVSDAVTAARPGAIETLGFKVAFSGDTASLRRFLGELNRFEYPIVVRSVDVERPSGEETTAAPEESGGLEDIFGVFGNSSSSIEEKEAAAEELSKPVIQGNRSRFTIVMEYFQIVNASGESSTQEQS